MNFSFEIYTDLVECVDKQEFIMHADRMLSCGPHGLGLGMIGFFCFECILT